jgi:hypothetical protein
VTPRIIRKAGHLEIASGLLKTSLLGKPPREARVALELRASLYTAAAELQRPRDVEILFDLSRMESHNPKFLILCERLKPTI